MVVLVVALKPGQAPHPPHRHAEEEFMILAEGTGTWHLDGKELPARKGDVVYAAPWTMHGLKNTGDAPLTYYMVKWNNEGAKARAPSDALAFPIAPTEEKAIRRIYLGVGDGWRLELRSDGTAHLGYGAADAWLVKPNTFDFAATLKALRSVARKQGFAGGRHYRVSFFPEGEKSPIQGYIQDGKLVLGLFDKAVEGLQNRNDRFDKLWKEQPPFKIEGK
jgi:hypothetical protein